MHDELFKRPAIVARYRAGPYAESRERFLKQACADGYSRPTLGRIAWALLFVAKVVHRNGGTISIEQLRLALRRYVRLGLTARSPSTPYDSNFSPLWRSMAPQYRRVDGSRRSAASVCVRTDGIFGIHA
jgi:hypothetical protein